MLISLIREMQTKTSMRYHLILIRMAIIKKLTNNKYWRGHREKGTLLHCWWECKLIKPLWRIVWRFLKKLGIKLPYDPAIPLLGIYLEKPIIQKDTCTPVFIATLFTIARTFWVYFVFTTTPPPIACVHLCLCVCAYCAWVCLPTYLGMSVSICVSMSV